MSREERICRRGVKWALRNGEITLLQAQLELAQIDRVFGRPNPSTENEMNFKEKTDGRDSQGIA